jgi:hypothetical protein
MLAILHNEFGRHSYDRDKDHGDLYVTWSEAGFSLNSTPFVETLLASREIITKFKSVHKNDVVNVIYMTDGEGSGGARFPASVPWDARKGVIYLVDKKTKKKVKMRNQYSIQEAATELVRDVTGCKHIGFYLGAKHHLKSAIRYHITDGTAAIAARKSLLQNNFFATKAIGYDKYFYMTSSNSNIAEEELKIDSTMTKSKMAKAFMSVQNTKRSNRVLVSQFAEEIAS